MEYKDIKEIVKDMGDSKIDELKIEFPDGTKISMKKNEPKVLDLPERELIPHMERKENIEKVKVFIPIDNTKIFGVVSIGVDGYSSSDVGTILDDEYDICVRTGYHCAPLVHDFIDSLLYNGTIRVSLGYFNRKEDIDCLIKALKSL